MWKVHSIVYQCTVYTLKNAPDPVEIFEPTRALMRRKDPDVQI